MANYGAKIFNSSISGLAAQQAVIAATANNIANVSTPGYSRRVVDLQTRVIANNSAEMSVGDGVDVGGLNRMVDTYLERILKGATTDSANYETQSALLSRLEPLFSLDTSAQTIGNTLNAFFTAVNDLTVNPSSVELRANVITKAEDLVSTLQSTYNSIASLQTECDQRVSTEVESINTLTSQIAALNGQITSREGGTGVIAADERDRREQLMNQLAEKVGFSSTELADGSVTISLPNGFTLVSGSSNKELEVTHKNPSDPVTGTVPSSLSGNALGYVVFNYGSDASPAYLDLTEGIMNGGGELGAVLTVRGYADPANTSPFEATGPLVDMATRVEAISRSLLQNVNMTYLGRDIGAGPPAAYVPSSRDLNGDPPSSPYGLFDFNFGGVKDVNGNGKPDDLDLVGLKLPNYTSLLQLKTTDPRKLCAADAISDGAGGYTSAPGDATIMQNIAAMQKASITFSNVGGFSLTGTFDEAYNESVIRVGSYASTAKGASSTAEKYLQTVQAQRDEVSAVSLDEEFTNLIRYQKAYSASARLVKVADQLLDQLVSLI